jgi:ATP-dependent RNA helicase RhlE
MFSPTLPACCMHAPNVRIPHLGAKTLTYKKVIRNMTDFSGFQLAQPILRALNDEGYTTPTPIQEKALPVLLDGRDLVGIAQTGTGKTAAFALPILNHLAKAAGKTKSKRPQALILAPTRELAAQIGDSFAAYGRYLGLRFSVVFGGTSIRPQIRNLERGVHILVATPGRLLDLMSQGAVQLGSVEFFVLDEADRMLDMGFIRDVRKIVATMPKERQTALFSATMPAAIEDLAATLLSDPARVEATPQASTAERVAQSVLFVAKDNKRALLTTLLKDRAIERVLVFTRTKHGANRVAEHLHATGVAADAIHGNKSQSARQRALKDFRAGRIRALVATDIAARGIDVDGVTHVINFELPVDPESYVHRIGRTARAGNTGIAISFCDHGERATLRDIERTIRQPVAADADHPFHAAEIADAAGGRRSNGQGKGNGHRNGHGHGQRRDEAKRPDRQHAWDPRQGEAKRDERQNGQDQRRVEGRRTEQEQGEGRDWNRGHGKRKPADGGAKRHAEAGNGQHRGTKKGERKRAHDGKPEGHRQGGHHGKHQGERHETRGENRRGQGGNAPRRRAA